MRIVGIILTATIIAVTAHSETVLVSMGSGGFQLAKDSSLSATQSSSGLIFNAASLGDAAFGYLQSKPVNWSAVSKFGIKSAMIKEGDAAMFRLELYDADYDPDNGSSGVSIYEGSTLGLTVDSQTDIELSLKSSGADLSKIVALGIYWDGAGGSLKMSSLVSLAAVPTPTPTPTPVVFTQGRFEGLVGTGSTAQSAAEFLGNNGIISVKTTANRSFSGTLRMGADKIAFSGVFQTNGVAEIKGLPRKSGLPAIDLTLRLEAGPRISGEVSQLPFVAMAPAPGTVAKYTVALVPKTSTAYAGYGYATLATDSKGAAKITGKLADGSKFLASTVISDGTADGLPADKLVPVFVPLGKTQGLLTGEIQIDKIELSQGSSVDDGGQPWGWVRSGSPELTELNIRGRSFAVTKGVSILAAAAAAGDFSVSGALMDTPLHGIWAGSNKPAFADANYKLSFSTSSGGFAGSVKNPKSSYEGVMFSAPVILSDGRDPVHGAGFRLAPGASLPVEITAL